MPAHHQAGYSGLKNQIKKTNTESHRLKTSLRRIWPSKLRMMAVSDILPCIQGFQASRHAVIAVNVHGFVEFRLAFEGAVEQQYPKCLSRTRSDTLGFLAFNRRFACPS